MCDDWPQKIKYDILNYVNSSVHPDKPNTYSLTRLLTCVRKTYYSKVNPKPVTDVKRAWPLFIGRLLDERWTPLFANNQVRTTWRCRNVPITISGKYDYLDENNVLTDLKCIKTLYYVKQNNAPSIEYVKQVRFYAYLNSLEHAQIQYIGLDGEAKVFSVEVGDCTDLLNELEDKAAKLYMALLTKEPPAKEQGWICQYCDYQQECQQAGEPQQ